MSEMKQRPKELTRLFKRLRPSELARGLGISSAAVYAWREIPLDRIADVERISGVPREQLRPDIFIRRKSRLRSRARTALRDAT